MTRDDLRTLLKTADNDGRRRIFESARFELQVMYCRSFIFGMVLLTLAGVGAWRGEAYKAALLLVGLMAYGAAESFEIRRQLRWIEEIKDPE